MKLNVRMTFVILQEMFHDALLTELRLYVKLNIVKKLVIINSINIKLNWISKITCSSEMRQFVLLVSASS